VYWPHEQDIDLESYSKLVCALLDVPVYGNVLESLHVLFSLFLEFKANPWFNQAAAGRISSPSRPLSGPAHGTGGLTGALRRQATASCLLQSCEWQEQQKQRLLLSLHTGTDKIGSSCSSEQSITLLQQSYKCLEVLIADPNACKRSFQEMMLGSKLVLNDSTLLLTTRCRAEPVKVCRYQ